MSSPCTPNLANVRYYVKVIIAQIYMTEERDGSTKDWSNWVEYDVSQRFFKKFNVGYIGKIEILREIE